MIEPKEKPCKGEGIAKGYGCGKMTKYRVYGLGKMCCYADWLLNSEKRKNQTCKSSAKSNETKKGIRTVQERTKEKNESSNIIRLS